MPEEVIPGVPVALRDRHPAPRRRARRRPRVARGAADQGRRQRGPPVELRRGRPRRAGIHPRALRSGAVDVAPQGRRAGELGRLREGARREAGRLRQGPGRAAASSHAAHRVADRHPHAGGAGPALPEGTRPHVVGRRRQQRPRGREGRLRRGGQHALRVRQGARHPVARQRLPADRVGERPGDQALRGGPQAPLARATR